MGGLCTHLPPQQEAAHIAASASIINYSQWFASFRISADNANHSVLHDGFRSHGAYKPFCLWPSVTTDGVQRGSEKPAGLYVAWGTCHGATRVGFFHRVWGGSERWHLHGQGSHEVGLFLSQYMSPSFPEILVCRGWFTTAEVPKQQEALAKSGVTKPPHKAGLGSALQNSHFIQYSKIRNPRLRTHKVRVTLLYASICH